MDYYFWWDQGYDKYQSIQPRLEKSIQCQWCIVGGGLSGLHAALELVNQGEKDIVLIDQFECGRGTTGASTGFVMPDAEEGLAELIHSFGDEQGLWLWDYVQQGCDLIATTGNKLGADIEMEDTLYIALQGKERDIEEEFSALQKTDRQVNLLQGKELDAALSAYKVTQAIQYGKTCAINPLHYAHFLKMHLLKKGVTVFEYTSADIVAPGKITTKLGTIHAKNIIVTVNKPQESITPLAKKIGGVQSSAAVSRPLSKREVLDIFPDNQRKMVYDSRDFYLYWRLTSDDRIILGKDSILTLLSPYASKRLAPVTQAIKSFRYHFPDLAHVEFEHYWSEIIDGSFDLIPIIHREGMVTYSGGNVGLPWAARTGQESALVALGAKIRDILSTKRSPYQMYGSNPFIKMAQYAAYYQISKVL